METHTVVHTQLSTHLTQVLFYILFNFEAEDPPKEGWELFFPFAFSSASCSLKMSYFSAKWMIWV